ncbi:MAG: hypothetical protein IPO50_15525 [Sphingomonadales bacterium]|nr:hypothetical protein [Sphingomonadales bacterium]
MIFANRNKLRVAKLGTKPFSPNSRKPIRCDFQGRISSGRWDGSSGEAIAG